MSKYTISENGKSTISDYNEFDRGATTAKTLKDNIQDYAKKLDDQKSNLNDESVFLGPICEECISAFATATSMINVMDNKFGNVKSVLNTTKIDYQETDKKISNAVIIGKTNAIPKSALAPATVVIRKGVSGTVPTNGAAMSINRQLQGNGSTFKFEGNPTGSLTKEQREKIVNFAESQIGVAYNYGPWANGGGGSWENDIAGAQLSCNGLTRVCYEAAGISIPVGSQDQMNSLKIVSTGSLSQVQPGDIICFDSIADRGKVRGEDYQLWSYDHVAIYAGNGMIIESTPSAGVRTRAIGDNEFSFAVTYGGNE